MAAPLLRFFNDSSTDVRGKIVGISVLLIGFNVAAWGCALYTFWTYPKLLGMALMAYTFGLRHAVDADHIAAIDNVTRKLMQDGKRPVSVGLFFSLGHSTIVIVASLAIAMLAIASKDQLDSIGAIGGTIGTLVSAVFLLAIAIMNIVILVGTWRTFRQVKAGGRLHDEDLDLLAKGGVMARIFRPMFRLVGRSWQMYPLGFLFGLGFDTATQIGFLGISAAAASQGLPIWSIMIFPALFTAGMALVDTADGLLMLGAYGWAFVKPIRKLYYNMTITAVSVVVALVVGGLEALNLIGDKLELKGAFWEAVGSINDSFGLLGYLIIGIFLTAWLISYLIYRVMGYDRIEAAAWPRIAPPSSVRISTATCPDTDSRKTMGRRPPTLDRLTASLSVSEVSERPT